MIEIGNASDTSIVISSKVRRYLELLKEYITTSEEETLIKVSEFGRELLLAGVPPEEAGEIHQLAVGQLAQENSHISLKEAAVLFSSPLVELLMAYGLAFREQMESHHEKHLDMFVADNGLVRLADQEPKEKQLFQADKDETVGALLSWVSHDLNNIMSVILGYSELTMSLSAADSKAYKNLQQILIAGGRAKELVAKMQLFIRDDVIVLHKINPSVLCKDWIPFLNTCLSDRITISPHAGDMKDGIPMDPMLMSLAIFNISVLMRQLSGSTDITLRVDLDNEYRTDSIPDSRLLPGLYLKIILKGVGQVLHVENPDMIFHPLFMNQQSSNSVNVGMTVAQRIISRHNGVIRVVQDQTEGMQIQVYLPYSPLHSKNVQEY